MLESKVLKRHFEVMSELMWQSCNGCHGVRRQMPRHLGAALAVLALGIPAGSHFATAAGTSVMLNAPMPLLGASRPAPGTPGYAPAPTPDVDARSPPDVRLNPGPQWGASLQSPNPQHTLRPGAGANTHSDFSEDLQRRRVGVTDGLAPTLNWKVPLQ